MVDLDSAIGKLLAAAERASDAAQNAGESAREAKTAANGAQAAANAATTAVHDVGREVRLVRREVKFVWRAVFGPDVEFDLPAPPPGVDPLEAPLPAWSKPPVVHVAVDANKRSAENTGDVAEMRGELMAIRTELGKQSHVMGIDRGIDFFFSKEGQRSMFRMLGAIGGIIAGIGMIVGACRAPASVPPPSSPTMIVLPPTATLAPVASASRPIEPDAGVSQP